MPSVYQTLFGGNPVAPAIPTYLPLSFSVNTVLGWPLESNINSPAVAEWIDCTATAPALTLQLSDARQVSTGYTAIFNNAGANTFTVLDAQGNTLMSPTSGTAWILVLTDNSTLQGTWRALQLGAGTSAANAAALAGSGLKAITTTLNERIFINAQAANYAIQTTADRASCIEWTGGSGGTFTTPTAAAAGSDWFCYIKNSGTGVLTVTPGSGTIDGTANKTFNPNDSCIVVCDGSNFFTMGFGQSVASSFNFVTISLAGASGTVVLTGAQLNRISYKFTGLLAGNTVVQVPASIQQYWVDNETTGAFTLTISAGGAGTTFAVPQANRVILYCDGLNIVNAITGGGVQFGDGTAAAPSITFASDTTLGFYKAGADVLGISTAGVQRGTINANGQWVIATPSSGVALTVNAVAAQYAGVIAAAAGNVAYFAFAGNNGVAGTSDFTVGQDGSSAAALTNRANAALTISTNNIVRVGVGAAGNVTVNAPSSGVALAVTAVSTSAAMTLTGAGAGTEVLRIDDSAGDARVGLYSAATEYGLIQVTTNVFSLGAVGASTSFILNTNGTSRVTVSAAGNVTVNAPSSGTNITVQGIVSAATVLLSLVGGTNGSAPLGLTDGQTGNRQWIIEAGNPAIGNFRIRDNTAGADRVVLTTGGVLTLPSGVQPAFYATENAGQTLTASTSTTLAFNTVQFNQGSNYSTGTNQFTAPVAGLYLFTCMCWIQNNSVGSTTLSMWFSVNSSAAGTNQIVPIGFTINPSSQQAMYPGSVILKLNASDTVRIIATVGGNALQHGSPGSNQSSFCGYLLG